jgi:hypothetical protein
MIHFICIVQRLRRTAIRKKTIVVRCLIPTTCYNYKQVSASYQDSGTYNQKFSNILTDEVHNICTVVGMTGNASPAMLFAGLDSTRDKQMLTLLQWHKAYRPSIVFACILNTLHTMNM